MKLGCILIYIYIYYNGYCDNIMGYNINFLNLLWLMVHGHPSHAIGILTNKWVESKQIPMKINWLLPSTNMAVRYNPTSDHGTYKRKGYCPPGANRIKYYSSTLIQHFKYVHWIIEPKKWENEGYFTLAKFSHDNGNNGSENGTSPPLMSKLLRVQEALRSGEPRHSEAGLDRTAPILTEIRGIGIDLITTIWASPDNYWKYLKMIEISWCFLKNEGIPHITTAWLPKKLSSQALEGSLIEFRWSGWEDSWPW